MLESTLKWPEPLLQEARKAASASNKSLESFILQAVQNQLFRQNNLEQAEPQKETLTPPKSASSSATSTGWCKERFRKDRIWIDSNYQTLVEAHPNQWLIVYQQKVIGADRDFGRAQDQAEEIIGNVHQAGALGFFTAARN